MLCIYPALSETMPHHAFCTPAPLAFFHFLLLVMFPFLNNFLPRMLFTSLQHVNSPLSSNLSQLWLPQSCLPWPLYPGQISTIWHWVLLHIRIMAVILYLLWLFGSNKFLTDCRLHYGRVCAWFSVPRTSTELSIYNTQKVLGKYVCWIDERMNEHGLRFSVISLAPSFFGYLIHALSFV